MQSWGGSAWVTVPGGSITGNNKVWRQVSFSDITTSKIRVLVNGALASHSRITEVEAYQSTVWPTVTLTSPANNATFASPANVTISADASDSDGVISKVEFFQGSTKLGEQTTSPFSFTWNNPPLGGYSLTARATDNAGATTTSNAVSITVQADGSITGKVTRLDGTTAIVGAVVKLYQGASVVGMATTNATGDYTVGTIVGGTYSVEASAGGYRRSCFRPERTRFSTAQTIRLPPIGGSPVSVATTTPGQNALVTFNGAAGQQVSLNSTSNIVAWALSVLNPDGSILGTASGSFIDNMTLPTTGAYTILVNPIDMHTGNATLTLHNVADVTGSLTIGSPPVSTTITYPGQRSRLTFSGTAGQKVSLQGTNNTMSLCTLTIQNPDGSSLASIGGAITAAPWIDTKTLPATGSPVVTALAGQVLKLNGQPLAKVTIQIDGDAVGTDETGRFLLPGVKAGHRVMMIHGHTAGRPGKTYGMFEVGVDIRDRQTNSLPYTIWMPVIDNQHATKLAVPTSSKVIARTPHIPDLEVHIPERVKLRNVEGDMTRFSITPIPADRPPFPGPRGAKVFFALQTHGARVESVNGNAGERVEIIFPNVAGAAPGSTIDLFSYSAKTGWHIYGQGQVTKNGKQIKPPGGVTPYLLRCVWAVGPPTDAPAHQSMRTPTARRHGNSVTKRAGRTI